MKETEGAVREIVFPQKNCGKKERKETQWEQWEMNVFGKCLKAEAHTEPELEMYLVRVLHARKLPEDSRRCTRMRDVMKTELLDRDAPWLLPRPVSCPSDKSDAKKLKQFFDYMARREEKARAVPFEIFPTEFSFYEIGIRVSEKPSQAQLLFAVVKSRLHRRKITAEGRKTGAVLRIGIEKKHQLIRAEAFGEKPALYKAGRLIWEIYSFYGVSEEDIREKSQRFKNLYRASRLWGYSGPEPGNILKRESGKRKTG